MPVKKQAVKKTAAKKPTTKKTAPKKAAPVKSNPAPAGGGLSTGKKTFYKVLLNGASCHGGAFEWSLPTETGPGDWHTEKLPLIECKRGFHLTDRAEKWWKFGADCFEVEVGGELLPYNNDGHKICVEKVRLIRKLSIDELKANFNIHIVSTGEHHVKDAVVEAKGDAQVTATGSSQVTATGSSQVTAYESSQVTARDRSQVTARDRSQVTATGSSQVTARDRSQVTAKQQSTVIVPEKPVFWWESAVNPTVGLTGKAAMVDRRSGDAVFTVATDPDPVEAT
jgi:hypothetical protein